MKNEIAWKFMLERGLPVERARHIMDAVVEAEYPWAYVVAAVRNFEVEKFRRQKAEDRRRIEALRKARVNDMLVVLRAEFQRAIKRADFGKMKPDAVAEGLAALESSIFENSHCGGSNLLYQHKRRVIKKLLPQCGKRLKMLILLTTNIPPEEKGGHIRRKQLEAAVEKILAKKFAK